ncbi:TIGR04222 domain-containing membrane protein, partial [Streptomyces katsurahamanus]
MDRAVLLINLIAGLSSLGLIIGWRAVRPRLRPPVTPEIHDVYEAAFLGGGPARVVDAALTGLHSGERVLIGEPGIVSVQNPVAADPVERAVLDQLAVAPNGSLNQLRHTVMRGPVVQRIGHGLAAQGLMAPPSPGRRVLRFWSASQTTLSVLALLAAIVLTVVGAVLDWERPDLPFAVLVLPGLLFAIITGAVITSCCDARITPAGKDALAVYRKRYADAEAP